MNSDHMAFDAFHWLPEENPANVVELSSDDDDKNETAVARPKNEDETPKETEPSAESKAASAAFRKAIGTSIPIYLTDIAVRQKIRAAAISTLEVAVSSGITLDSLFMDSNCLPAWAGREWDPEVQTLHEVIQSRLVECQDAQELGSSLRGVIVQLGNERIQEAIRLGLELGDVTIGEDLLPTWRGRDGSVALNDDDDTSDDKDDDNNDGHNNDDDNNNDDNNGNNNGNNNDDDDNNDGGTIVDAESSVDGEDVVQPAADSVKDAATDISAMNEDQPPSAWSSESQSDDSESKSESMSDYDDEISLFNFVCQHPVIEENDEDAPLKNIVHNVEVFGPFSDSSCPMDFEVYLAEDDPDIEQLPGVELAIDEDAFAHHFQLADVTDLELADGGLYWVTPQNDVSDQEMEEMEAPESTGESPEKEVWPDEPMTPPSAAETEGPAGWVVI